MPTSHASNFQSNITYSPSATAAQHQHYVRSTRAAGTSGELILIRGLPGSGKSTIARKLASNGFKHYEADMFFEVDGRYEFDPSRIRDAHSWCQQMTRKALACGNRVVVSNTFTQLREMEPYLDMTRNVGVIEANGHWQNLHEVPVETLERMARRWESLPASVRRVTLVS